MKTYVVCFRHYWKNSPRRETCDGECRKRLVCDAKSGRSHDRRALCSQIEARIDGSTPAPQTWRAWFYNGLSVSWVGLTHPPPHWPLFRVKHGEQTQLPHYAFVVLARFSLHVKGFTIQGWVQTWGYFNGPFLTYFPHFSLKHILLVNGSFINKSF